MDAGSICNSIREADMQVTITLTDKEVAFLKRIAGELGGFERKETSLEDAIHECIKMAIYDESEEGV